MQERVRFRLRIYITVLAAVVICGTIGLTAAEDLHPFDAFYFVIVTIATVGFGDISPQTVPGKIITLAVIITGVGCFVALAANVFEFYMSERERTERLRKINMLVGVFYSEIGTDLLRRFSAADPDLGVIKNMLVVSTNWSETDFVNAVSTLSGHNVRLDSRNLDLPALNRFLSSNKPLMVAMLENPYLIEHDAFTELMQALFHLTEELRIRERLIELPKADYDHLSGDGNRVYELLIREWLMYMKHLKTNYPYLFSLAMRTNPFDANASVIVR
ncbi:MAG: potassium channel family protein [Methanoregula sp.]|nr:MAG: potassium channel family protein [Methanoregula sp.]